MSYYAKSLTKRVSNMTNSSKTFETPYPQFKQLVENYLESLGGQKSLKSRRFINKLREKKLLREKVIETKRNYQKNESSKKN